MHIYIYISVCWFMKRGSGRLDYSRSTVPNVLNIYVILKIQFVYTIALCAHFSGRRLNRW